MITYVLTNIMFEVVVQSPITTVLCAALPEEVA